MNSVGNVEAKEHICMNHGHELKGGNVGGQGCAGQRGVKGGKWDNCNSIINEIYFFKKERNLNRAITRKEIKSVIKNLPQKKSLGPDGFIGKFYKMLKN